MGSRGSELKGERAEPYPRKRKSNGCVKRPFK